MEQWIRMSRRITTGLGIAAMVFVAGLSLVMVNSAMAQGEGGSSGSNVQQHSGGAGSTLMPKGQASERCWAFLAAALATGIGSLAAGYAVGQVGTAAMGAVAEKPELMGKSLIYVALAEGIAIYGLLIAIIVLAKV